MLQMTNGKMVWLSNTESSSCLTLCNPGQRENTLFVCIGAPLRCYFPVLTSPISNASIKHSHRKSYCIRQQAAAHLFRPVSEWKVVTSALGGECVIGEKVWGKLSSITTTQQKNGGGG